MMDFRRFYSQRKLQKPLTLLPLSLKKNEGRWADLGCGDGIFSVVLADLLTPTSTLYAIDREMAGLAFLAEVGRSNALNIPVYPIQADFQTAFPLSYLDGLLFANSLHYIPFEIREIVLERLANQLNRDGQLIIVEYNTRNRNAAIPYPLDEIEFYRLMKACGLSDPQIAARVPSTFGREMYAGTAYRS